MKNISHANRGMPFEAFVKFACERYKRYRLAVIDKVPTEFIPIRNGQGKVVTVKVEKKSTVDFIGRYKSYPLAMEAKHSSTDTIRWDAVQEHQADYLDAFGGEEGTIGLVVVSFGLRKFYAIPWVFWSEAYSKRVRPGASKTTRVQVSAYGVTWDIPTKNSFRVDEIPPEFEISGNDRTYGLHFLANAENYITPKVTITLQN